jgi:hypothetical protein
MKRGLVMVSGGALLIAVMAGSVFAQRSSIGAGASGVSISSGGSHHGGHPSLGHGGYGSSWGLRMAALGYGGYYGTGAGWGGGWGAWFPGYPNDPLGYETGRIPTPPYFAIHPPVYYGKRVGMPYGNSTVTRPPRPVLDDSLDVGPFQTAAQPLMIDNPYVEDVQQATADVPAETNVAAVGTSQVSEEQAAQSKRVAREARRSSNPGKSARSNQSQKARKRRG